MKTLPIRSLLLLLPALCLLSGCVTAPPPQEQNIFWEDKQFMHNMTSVNQAGRTLTLRTDAANYRRGASIDIKLLLGTDQEMRPSPPDTNVEFRLREAGKDVIVRSKALDKPIWNYDAGVRQWVLVVQDVFSTDERRPGSSRLAFGNYQVDVRLVLDSGVILTIREVPIRVNMVIAK